MSSPIEPVVGRLVGDNTDYVRSLSDAERRTGGFADDTERHFGRMGASVKNFAKIAAVGLGAVAVGVGAFLKSSVEAAEESRKVMAQTEAVIKSTGGAANVSAEGVGKLADQLAALTGIDDEAIASTENLLLTFTNVRNQAGKGNDVFNQATKTVLDMSTALGTDAKGAAIQLGKALNDPIRGVGALAEVGVTFTEQQRAQIKAMVESGDVLGAQKIILKELATEFGGSAEAAASPMERLKVVVGNLQEQLGARFLPIIGKVAGALADKLPGALDLVAGGFRAFSAAFKAGDGDITSNGFAGAMELIAFHARKLVDQFKEWWPAIKETVVDAVDAIVGWVRQHWPEIRKIITDTVKAVQSVIAGVVDVVTTIWENFGDQIIDVAEAAWRFVRDTIEGALRVIQGIVKVVTGIIHGDWGQVWEGIKEIVSGAWEMIKARIDLALNLIKNIISVGMEIVKATFSEAWNAIFETCRNVLASVVDVFLGFVGIFVDGAAKAFGWIPGIGGKLREARDWFHEFRDDVNDAIRGIDGQIIITADTTQAWLEINNLQAYERNVNSVELQSQGYTTSGNQQFARGMDMGPVRGRMGEAVPITAHAGEWVLTQEQLDGLRRTSVAGGSIVATPASGGRGDNTYIIQIITATGDIPDETIRKIRSQLFELENDMPSGQIIPAA